MEEGPINFKALRAKFQEEALLTQSRTSRPAVAEKPRHLPPPGGHCSSVVSCINIAVENKTPVVPRVIFRDGLRSSGGKRPISFPPQPRQTSPSSQPANGDGTARQSLKDRHMPLVLPVPPLKELPAQKEHKQEPEPAKETLQQTKIKKKGLLLPFKSAKASKVNVESREEPTYADLTTRPSSAPGELPSVEKHTTDDGVSLPSDQSAAEFPPSSPDAPKTPPSADTSVDSDNKMSSTLERAKKKFSRKQMFISAKPKSLRSPDYTQRDKAFPSPPKSIDSVDPELPVPPPVCLPHLACISARPFFKAGTFTRKPALDKQFDKDKSQQSSSVETGDTPSPSAPPMKTLPDLKSLGPLPPKPSRPPRVVLSCYQQFTAHEDLCSAPNGLPESFPSSELAAPEFPEFNSSELEAPEGDVDIGVLDLESLDLVSTYLPAPDGLGVTDIKDPTAPDLSESDPVEAFMSTSAPDLILDSPSIIPLDPDSFPEPINLPEFPESGVSVQQSLSKEVGIDPLSNSQDEGTDLEAAEPQTDSVNHTALDDGVRPHPGVNQQDSYYEACDNVYEDVENINKFILSQNSQKRKASLKNPYADSHITKEEVCPHTWTRNPWGSLSGEHTHSAYNHVLSKERQSPNTADHKEQKKREKQRLEKEKKEQKEREKKENEMKKKFKVTGEEEPMYHARVIVASKARKNDLPVKSGDTVSIIRTTSCPKGKWLARDASHKYGYISVMNVELNIKEMLELGKKAQAAGRGGNLEGDTISIGSRSSSHPVLTSSFTDDSEEWACEDETLSPSNESHSFPRQAASMPEMSCEHFGAQHTLSDANLEDLHTQTRHEALQKLAIFFQHSKEEFGHFPDGEGATPTNPEPPNFLSAVEEPPYPEQEVDFTELELFPPPPLYADSF